MSYDLKITGGNFRIVNGSLETVTDTDKLVQELLKIISTSIGANPEYPLYGCSLGANSIGTADLNPMERANIVKGQIEDSISTLMNFQESQRLSGQYVSQAEQIAGIKSVNVTLDKIDYRKYYISVIVISRDLKQRTASLSVSL